MGRSVCGFGDTDFTLVDAMTCPVLCECGEWVELDDTVLPPGEISGKTICQFCYEEMVSELDEDDDGLSHSNLGPWGSTPYVPSWMPE